MIQKCSRLLLALSVLLVGLTGCAPDQPAITVAPTAPSTLAVLTSTSTPAAPVTAVAPRTRTPVAATTSAPTLPAVSVTPEVAASPALWQDARVLSGGFLDNWEYLVIFETSSPLQGGYRAVVDLNKTYQCEVRPNYPQRLYCWGRQVRYEADAPIVVYNDRHEIVFEGQFHTPAR